MYLLVNLVHHLDRDNERTKFPPCFSLAVLVLVCLFMYCFFLSLLSCIIYSPVLLCFHVEIWTWSPATCAQVNMTWYQTSQLITAVFFWSLIEFEFSLCQFHLANWFAAIRYLCLYCPQVAAFIVHSFGYVPPCFDLNLKSEITQITHPILCNLNLIEHVFSIRIVSFYCLIFKIRHKMSNFSVSVAHDRILCMLFELTEYFLRSNYGCSY